jgi:hypothetical protein
LGEPVVEELALPELPEEDPPKIPDGTLLVALPGTAVLPLADPPPGALG